MPLTIKLSSTPMLDSPAEVIAIGVTEAALEKQKALVALDHALHEQLFVHAARSKFTGASGQVLDIPSWGHVAASRIVLVGMGKIRRGVDAAALRALAATAARQAISAASLALSLPEKVAGPEALRAVGEGLGLPPEEFQELVVDIVEEIDLGEDLDRLRYGE